MISVWFWSYSKNKIKVVYEKRASCHGQLCEA
jgi:hypothetical protein